MRIEDREDGTIDVYVRQSWLNDAVACAERGRQQMLRPSWSLPNELTVLGTAVHSAIEALLTQQQHRRPDRAMVDDSKAVAQRRLTELFAEPMRWVRHTEDKVRSWANDLFCDWYEQIYPKVGTVRHLEHGFEFKLDTFVMDNKKITVYGVGTVDCVADELWDWKTAGKKYSQREKQQTAIQPTMYAAAAVAQGLAEWPVRFNYGVMVRDGGPQMVTVVRTVSHVEWLIAQIRPLVRQAVTDQFHPWPRNDTHFLCSETWCPWWSICKGAFLAPSDNTMPLEGANQ